MIAGAAARLPSDVGDAVWDVTTSSFSSLIRTYFSLTSPDGDDVMHEEWDQLVILDGCRYDTFTEHNTLAGTLSTRISHGAQTPEFLRRNFGGASFSDTVYVTANPIHRVPEWCDVDLDSVFHEVVDVWADRWDDEFGTVTPEEMADATARVHERYPDRRLITHFVQPHYPFLGPTGRELEHSGLNGKRRADDDRDPADERTVWTAAREGVLAVEEVRSAYEENLRLALPHVRELVAEFDGTTVVTSDHGNHLGEFATPFPIRLYGHPEGIRTPELIRVPWLVVSE